MVFLTDEMNIGRIFDYLHYLSRKDPLGNTIAPGDEFDSICQMAVYKYFKKIFGLPDEYQKGAERPRFGYESNLIMTEKIRPLKSIENLSIVGKEAEYPVDFFRYSSVTVYNDDLKREVGVLPMNDQEWEDIVTCPYIPDKKHVYCNFRVDSIIFSSSDYNEAEVRYIRYPTNPKMGFAVDKNTATHYYVNTGAYLAITGGFLTGNVITVIADSASLGTYIVQALDTNDDVMQGIADSVNVNTMSHKVHAVYDGEKIVFIDYTDIYNYLTVDFTGNLLFTKENFLVRSVEFDWIKDIEAMNDIVEIIIDMIGISNRDIELVQWAEKEKAT